MKLKHVAVRGITRFGSEVAIDYGSMPDGLVAIIGPNGAGKTTLMEAIPAALYKTMPSRPGSLYDHAHGRDAFVEAIFEEGWGIPREIKIRVQVDAEGRKTEGYVFVDGEPVTTGRAAEFDAEIAKRFGSYELFLSSVFAAQNKAGSFLVMPKGDRKAIFAELLGTSRLETVSQSARAKRTALEGEVQAGRSVLKHIEDEAFERIHFESLAKELRGKTWALELEVGPALDAWMAAKARLDECSARVAEVAPLRADLEREESSLRILRHKEQDLASKIVAHAETTMDKVRRRKLAQGIADQPLKEGHARAQQAGEKMARLKSRLDKLEEVRVELGRVDALLNQKQSEWQSKQTAANDEINRNSRAASLLGKVPCLGMSDLVSTCELLKDARTARDTEVVIGWPELAREVESLIAKRSQLVLGLEGFNALRETYHEAQTAQDEALRDIDYDQKIKAAVEAVAALSDVIAELGRAGEMLTETATMVEEEIKKAEFRCGEVRGKLAAFEGLDVKPLEAEVSSAAATLKAKRDALQDHHSGIAAVEANAERCRAKEVEAEQQRAALEDLLLSGSDWLILERAFGREGIQALEIDAAGPEVASITNELLQGCYGSRFGVGFETLREKKSSRGEFTEVFDVKVYDEGRERAVESLSGGERVVVGEALGLAFAIFNARKSDVRWRTLFRDETAGALDPRNAEAYTTMLRKALVVGGFSQCIFVSHQDHVWERADVRVDLGAQEGRE